MTMTDCDSWTDLVPVVAKPAIYAYKYRKLIHEYWKKVQVKVGFGTPTVIITGRPGSGKSVLASHYHGEANNLDWTEPGTSADVEIKPIAIGDWTKIVAVIPGQNSAERARALDETLNKTSELEGIIHVVDWGYTAIRESAIKRDMIKKKGIDTIEKIRAHNLELELKDFDSMLEKISMSIANGRGPKWLVIAVNKVDLFEKEIHEAEEYYHPSCSGVFSHRIKSFYEVVGSHNIKIKCLPVFSMPESYVWNTDTVSSQIDSFRKLRNYLRTFIDQIAEIQNGAK